MKKRISRNDVIFLAILLAVVTVFLVIYERTGTRADAGACVRVTVDGSVYGTYALGEEQMCIRDRLVTVVQFIMQAYTPSLSESLGVYIPLIVVNCIILGRAESYASKNPVVPSLFDGLGMGLGFTMGLTPVSYTHLHDCDRWQEQFQHAEAI